MQSIFYVKGTVIEAIWPQLLLAVLIISAVKAVQIRWHYSFIFSQKMVSIHQILGTYPQLIPFRHFHKRSSRRFVSRLFGRC
jgi:predicted membrane chloride channel (bestrophin family)